MIRRYLNLVSLTKSQIIIFVLLNICGLLFFILPHNIFWNMLDLKFSYNEEILLKSFNAIGDEGRQVYYFSALILDTVYPFLYVSLFLGAYVKLFKNNSYIYIFPIARSIRRGLQIICHSCHFCHQRDGQRYRISSQNTPEEEEVFQLSARQSCQPMRRLSL